MAPGDGPMKRYDLLRQRVEMEYVYCISYLE